VLAWVPSDLVAQALGDLDQVEIEVVDPDAGAGLPASAERVEFYVPPFFPGSGAVRALASMPGLRVVQTMTAGVDLLRPHVPAGVLLCNARGVHDSSTAEWVVAAVLAARREFPGFAAEQADGRWSYRFTGALAGSTVLIVGYGSIGAAVERRLAGFEVTVQRVARTARPGVHPVANLADLLPGADVVILLAPVTAATIGMVDADFLAAMKDGALLVNAARGVLVRTDDLTAELTSGRLAAALDVTDPEPLPPGHPLWSLPNAFITPHVAASTSYSAMAAISFLRAQLERYRSGAPLANVITGAY
jgi:phosphoglycerate dehydrogenase-like enzyme